MSERLSDVLLAENRTSWEAMQAHRFVRAVERDELPLDVFNAYLVYEGDFVETAILIFGHMLVKAPSLAERCWLAGVIQALATEQLVYFERTDLALGITPAARARPLPPAVLAFRNGMLSVARDGAYLDGVVVMMAAEWLYATWCTRAAAAVISNPELRRWVDLHAEPAFLGQAEWLRRQVDESRDLGPEALRRLSGLFGRALDLEIDFHSAPFEQGGAA